MDSVTHIFLGGVVAALAVPARDRRRALFAGAVLNTLPDLDVVALALLDVDPITHVTWHRGPTHSLLLLPFAGFAIWMLLRRVWTPVMQSSRRWLWAVMLALLTHPLLDAFTAYGTQILWPLPLPSAIWSSLFIIDPTFTLPLLIAFVAALSLGSKPAARRWLVCGMLMSCAYLGWTLIAKMLVERAAAPVLALAGLHDAPRFSAPMPFNSVLWRVVVMTETGFLEGERSLIADRGPMRFHPYVSDMSALAAVAGMPDVQRLEWFTHGFFKAEEREGRLVLSDLRMGSEPDYPFRFVVARRDGRMWLSIPPEQLRWPWGASERLGTLWHRIWNEPDTEITLAPD